MQNIFKIKDFVHHETFKTQNLRFPGLINPDDICWMKITRISQNLRFIHYLKPEVLGVNCYHQLDNNNPAIFLPENFRFWDMQNFTKIKEFVSSDLQNPKPKVPGSYKSGRHLLDENNPNFSEPQVYK